MSPSDPSPERLERVKKILADSYPRLPEGQKPEPLPASVLADLQGAPGRARSVGPAGESFLDKISALFRGPQLAAVGVAAVLVIAAIAVIQPFGGTGDGQAMRSGGTAVDGPAVVVLHNLTDEQLAAIRASGYFRAEQLMEVPAGQDPDAFLAAHPQTNLVLVDGATGQISAPHAADPAPGATALPAGSDDIAPAILDLLSELPTSQAE